MRQVFSGKSARLAKVLALVISLLLGLHLADAATFEDIASGFYSIQIRHLRAMLQLLASKHFKGRATGTPEAELTVDYLSSQFESNGLKPPSDNDGSYVMAFDLVQSVPQPESKLTVRFQEGAEGQLRFGEDFIPAPWGPDSDLSGRLSFAGYGVSAPDLHYDDFAKTNVSGRVLMVLSNFPGGDKQSRWSFYARGDHDEPLEKAIECQKAGAIALLIVLPENENIPAIDSLSFKSAKTQLVEEADSIRIPVAFLTYAAASRLIRSEAAPDRLREIQEKIDRDFEPVSVETERMISLTTRFQRRSLKGFNVVGIIPGADPRLHEECIVIGAHHDHIGVGDNEEIYFGADDDASGTTGIMELASAFQAGHLRPRRSIVLAAWGAEELGLLGSKHYARAPVFPMEKTVAMIQLDMIGRNEERPASPSDGIQSESAEANTNSVNLAGTAFSRDLKKLFELCNHRTGLRLRYRYDSGQENLLKRSDQWSFLKARVPSVFLFTGFHPDYHRPGDTADKINYEKMEKIVQLVYLVGWELAEEPLRPLFQASETGVQQPAP